LRNLKKGLSKRKLPDNRGSKRHVILKTKPHFLDRKKIVGVVSATEWWNSLSSRWDHAFGALRSAEGRRGKFTLHRSLDGV